MVDVYIAYAREDEALALRLAYLLQQRGLTVWTQLDLQPDDFRAQIEAQLRSAKTVVALWTSASVKSEWVQAEAQFGLDRNVLFPVRVRGVEPPFPFSALQTETLPDPGDAARLSRLADAIAARAGVGPSGIAAPPKPPAAAYPAPPPSRSDSYAQEQTERTGSFWRAAKAPQAPTPATPPARFDAVEARAFAPKAFKRGSAELVQVRAFQPADAKFVERRVREADPSARPTGAARALGAIGRGHRIRCVLDVVGGACADRQQEAVWTGAPLEFDFVVQANSDLAVRQAVVSVRLFAEDAQIGQLSFVRRLAGGGRAAPGKPERMSLKRAKRVFLSYSSLDRELVAMIQGAYARAGIACFMDRTGLKSGEEWGPALKREIDRADLFHLCWSHNAARSAPVEEEVRHALQRRRRTKRPEITIQMLDGPPWAPHPQSFDHLNFDDFARAAVKGYAQL